MSEKYYYGLMILFVAAAVLASPFAYMRSLRFLDRRHKNRQFREHKQNPSAPRDDGENNEQDGEPR